MADILRKRATCASIAALSLLSMTACNNSSVATVNTTDNGNYEDILITADYVSEYPCSEEECESYSGDHSLSFSSNSASFAAKDNDLGEVVFNTEEYSSIEENIFKDVSISPLSTFAADVDTASYANVRRLINSGYTINDIPQGSIRAEEMINYFDYDYEGPQNNEPFGVNAEIAECPWNNEHVLLQIGLQTEEIDFSETPDSNIVFLIDVSGSMDSDDKLPLLQKSFLMLLDNLDEKDTISIVTYANGVKVVLDSVPASDKETITDAVNNLTSGGGTNGEGGIEEAYRIAEKNFIKEGNNRVILATDGDFNIGRSSQSDMSELIKKQSKKGIFLTVLGFGTGNYSDTRMETLADDGNGNYAYIDTLNEAKKVLVTELSANMLTVAKDVKLQVEFNPNHVASYRLVGYENRALNDEDFNDDEKDAGEIGAGHSVTVLYEIIPAGKDIDTDSGLKYQNIALTKEALESNDWLTLSVRYKEPDEDTSKLLEYEIGADSYSDDPSDDFKFASCVAEFAMILRKSDHIADGNMQQVVDTLAEIPLDDEYKREFATLADKMNVN